MSVFDRLKKYSRDSATAIPAILATDNTKSEKDEVTVARIAVASLKKESTEILSFEFAQEVTLFDDHVFSTIEDPPHIRFYQWSLENLRFEPVDNATSTILKIPSGEMDAPRIRKIAAELRMNEMVLVSPLLPPRRSPGRWSFRSCRN